MHSFSDLRIDGIFIELSIVSRLQISTLHETGK